MKIKDIVEIINKNIELTNKIVEYKKNLSTLQYLDINGNVKEEFKKIKIGDETYYDMLKSPDAGTLAILQNEKTIIKVNKPKLDEAIEEYKNWLGTEI